MDTIRIRRLINSETITVKELKKFLGMEVDIFVTTRRNTLKSKKQLANAKTAAAVLSKYKNEQLINKEQSIWTHVIKEKYEDR
jgi:peroxiredoxin family protein